MRTVEVVVINLDPDGELKSLAISHRLDSLLIVLALGYFAIILMYALEFDIRFLPLYGPSIIADCCSKTRKKEGKTQDQTNFKSTLQQSG